MFYTNLRKESQYQVLLCQYKVKKSNADTTWRLMFMLSAKLFIELVAGIERIPTVASEIVEENQ